MCFAVRQGELVGRADVTYNNPATIKGLTTSFAYKPLKSLVTSFSGGTPSKDNPDYWNGDIPWASPKDFTDFYLYDTEDHISEAGQTAASLKLAPENAVLVVVRSGILRHTLPITVATRSVTINQDIKSLITNDEVNSVFLAWYMHVAGEKILPLITKHSTTVQSINSSEFENLLIPLPPLDIQRQLVAELEAARTARKAKLEQADALLAGMDSFVLDQLGVTLPPQDERLAFAVRAGDLKGENRMNADYFHPERTGAIKSMKAQTKRLRSEPIANIADFIRDIIQVQTSDAYIGLASVQSNTGELIEITEEAEGQAFQYQSSDVLYGRLRPYLNKVHRAEKSGNCSTEFYVIRPRDETVLPDYLAAILRSSLILAQTRHMMTGNTHPRLNNDDVLNLIIPVPNPKTQNKIVSELTARRAQARHLRHEAETDWQTAKSRFEAALLGGA